jgi:hypothetical protein
MWYYAPIVMTIGAVGALTVAFYAKSSAVAPTSSPESTLSKRPSNDPALPKLQPRLPIDPSGIDIIQEAAELWGPNASLKQIAQNFDHAADRVIKTIDQRLTVQQTASMERSGLLWMKARALMYKGKPGLAYDILCQCRREVEGEGGTTRVRTLSNILYAQGIACLRRGEDENCVMCRGESSCILPISPAALHKIPEGSQKAILHFTEYLQHFPDDLEVRWLLNLAHMTLGEYPSKVDPVYLVKLDHYMHPEFDIGKFRDIGHLVGVNRFNQAGGAIMEDLNNDGLLDLVVSSFSQLQPLSIYQNTGKGTFEEVTKDSGAEEQLGGLSCVQVDYNNDGLLDIYIPRGAWLHRPIRPSLLRNDGDFHFTDVTAEAGLLDPVNSNSGMWADYDNDGWVDLFVACEKQPNRLYRNLGNGTFQRIGPESGLSQNPNAFSKGCTWLDYNNDDYPDLFVNNLTARGELYHNNRDGTFTDVTSKVGINGPEVGFSCWAWDYNNDGYMDIFATCYVKSLKDCVKGMMGVPHNSPNNKLYRNKDGQRFEDVTREAGLDMVFMTMGSNYGDFDNDGYLDFFLGTGEPSYGALIPDRMFKNVSGGRFAEITASAGVGHLQKGHAIACGDWDRDGNIDIFAEMGGAVDGDMYHNVLFQNPGHDANWISIKLEGKQTNRAALCARIKIVTDGSNPLTVHRHITPGSSFGSSPLEQTIGLAKATRIRELEIHWPTSHTTQKFYDLDVNQAIKITEFADTYEPRKYKRITHKNVSTTSTPMTQD